MGEVEFKLLVILLWMVIVWNVVYDTASKEERND